MAGPGNHGADEQQASPSSPLPRPQLQPQQPLSPLPREEFDEKFHAPSFETSHTQASAHDFNPADGDGVSQWDLRAEATRLNDDLELLRAERLVSNQEHELAAKHHKTRTHNPEPEDAFNQPVNKDPLAKPKNEDAALYRVWLFLKKFPRFVRYVVYLIPGAALLLIPVLLGAFSFKADEKLVGGNGGVELMWFGIWLEIVWCSLWLSRLITSLIPHLFHGLARIGGSTNAKKWKDVGQQLELHVAIFLWLLAVLISFMPTNNGHRGPEDPDQDVNMRWIDITNKVIIALFVLASLNVVEKVVIQWIATTFHQRTYATRIVNNKSDIAQLVQLYEYAKARLEHSDSFWQRTAGGAASGVQTPLQTFHENARQVLGKVGQVANKVGNDLIGRKVDTNVPRQVVSELLRTGPAAHTLARLIYRSLVRDGHETVYPDDLKHVFETQEEVDLAFSVFDKDLNGDISIEEFEAVCNEIHLEKKAIAASLKDLDSVIQKLDKVFIVIIVIISIIVFVSILSGSAAAALASAGTSFLGLAWMLQATAQEFLQSIIFVFIKHPFDVGDRVTIYGSTGTDLTGDDYYVTEISLLYTEFKKMQGHIVQAPNSLLNTLFILNQRRSNGLADVLPLEMRFGTPAHLIEELKARMLDYCLQNKRDFQPTILTEMTKIDEVRSCHMNMVFMHKSNFQNELLRLNRHNKFVTELMHQMTELGIQGPIRMDPGGSREYPMYYAGPPPAPLASGSREGPQGGGGGDDVPQQAHPQSTAQAPGYGMMRMRSASVRSQQRLPPTNEEAFLGFQDVTENRRDHVAAHRMASIKEKEPGFRTDTDLGGAVHATSSGISRTASKDSWSQNPRARLFGRVRSWRSHQDEQV